MKILVLLFLLMSACTTQKIVQKDTTQENKDNTAQNTVVKDTIQSLNTGGNSAQTLHLFLFAATEDVNPTIRQGALANVNHMKQLAQDTPNTKFNIIERTGKAFNKDNILNTVKQHTINPQDAVVLHFTGHGKASNSTDANKRQCPELYLTNATTTPPDWAAVTEEQLVNAYEFFDILRKKNPRLLVVFVEACAETGTKSIRTGEDNLQGNRKDNLNSLFDPSEKNALLILTCSRGEKSAIYPSGGVATEAAIDIINKTNFGGTWEGLFNILKSRLKNTNQTPVLIK